MSDIFVSYAHIDNQPFHEEKAGWITQFTTHLQYETGRRMGRNEHYSLWMDFRLNGNDAVTPEIEKQLRESKILLVMMSRGWLESEWCVKELEYFCSVHPDVRGQIFIVDQDGLPREEKPKQILDLLTYPFYEKTPQQQIRQLGYPFPQPTHQSYFDRVVDLSHQLAEAIRTPTTTVTTPVLAVPTVYVSPVHDDLFDKRNTLISELHQYGIQVLPKYNRHESKMGASLAQCSLFVQLLDANFAQGIPFSQHLMAVDSGTPVLQWRETRLNTDISNLEQHELLNGETVIACELSDFIRQVREAVIPKHIQNSAESMDNHNGEKLVFVQSSPEDFTHAQEVAETLKSRGYGTALPSYDGDAARIRTSMERGYQFCDILLILQQRASTDVIEDYLSEAQVSSPKTTPIFICQCKQAEKLSFRPSRLQILPCDGSFKADCLEHFLEADA